MGYLYGPIHKAGEEKLKIFQREKKKKSRFIYKELLMTFETINFLKTLMLLIIDWILKTNTTLPKWESINTQFSGLLDGIGKYSYGNPNVQGSWLEMKLSRNDERDFGWVSTRMTMICCLVIFVNRFLLVLYDT